MLEYVFNSNPQEAEAGGSSQCFLQAVLWVRSQLGPHETLSGVRACGGFGVAEAKGKDISEVGQGLSSRARQVTTQPCGLLWTLYWTQGRVGISLGQESWHTSKTEQTSSSLYVLILISTKEGIHGWDKVTQGKFITRLKWWILASQEL